MDAKELIGYIVVDQSTALIGKWLMADCYIVHCFDPPDQRNNMDIIVSNITPTTGHYLSLLDIILWSLKGLY